MVRQARNERLGRLRPAATRLSMIFDESDSSPQNISGPVAGPAVPSDWGPVAAGCSQHVQAFAVDAWARVTPVLSWLVYS